MVSKVKQEFASTLFFCAQMNAMLNFDAMTLGNHEFDDGAEGLEPFLRNKTVPMVVTNMDTT